MKLDTFTKAYIRTALWTTHGPKFGECPCCGRLALLDHLPEPEFEEEPMCSGLGCGVRELNNEPPLDASYSAEDLAPETLAAMVADCAKFRTTSAWAGLLEALGNEELGDLESDLAARSGSPDAAAGHDFWLTRNGHGAGFWDGDWPEPHDDTLTEAAHVFGEVWLYPGDDGKLYLSR